MTQILKANLDSLFQTALLLTAEPETAEESLASSLDGVDLSVLPQDNSFAILKEAIVLRCIQSARRPAPSDTANARSMPQRGLWPLRQSDRQPGVCFFSGTPSAWSSSS